MVKGQTTSYYATGGGLNKYQLAAVGPGIRLRWNTPAQEQLLIFSCVRGYPAAEVDRYVPKNIQVVATGQIWDLHRRPDTWENETARAKNKLATDVDKEEVSGRPEKQKVTLQNGREAIVTVQYIGEEYLIFDGNDPLVGEKLNFKMELVEIL